jgi:hypothetical protein
VISLSLSLSLSLSELSVYFYVIYLLLILVRLPFALLCLPVSWLVGECSGFCASCGIGDIVSI